MTEAQLREQTVSTLRGWLGWSETNGGHRRIVDLYNSHRPLAQGYRLKYTDAWCAATVSAAAITNGLTDIMPTECSCPRMISLYQALGRWQESDSHRPQPGDLIMYDWEDSGRGDNRGAPNHVGMVEQIKGDAITVIEGNYRSAVTRRTIPVNGRYIRGYCLPDYAAKAAAVADLSPTRLPVLTRGAKGDSVRALQLLLNGGGAGLEVDSSFGPATQQAVLAYQQAQGLAADGSVGPATWEALLL